MKLHKTAIALSLLVAGCSGSSTPSNSEIDQAMQTMFSACDPISIEDVEKTNGHPLEQGKYSVDFRFKVVLKPLEENKAIGREYMELIDKIPSAQKTYDETSEKMASLRQQQEEEEQAWSENAQAEVMSELRKILGGREPDERMFRRSYSGEFMGLSTGGAGGELPPEINEINERYKKNRDEHSKEMAQKYSKIVESLRVENENAAKILRGTTFGQNERHYFNELGRNVFKVCQLNDSYAKNIANQAVGITIGTYTKEDIERLMTKTEIEFTSTIEMIKTEKGWMFS